MVSWQPCDFVTSGQGPCRSPCLLSAHRSICTEALLLAFAFTDLTSRTFADHLPSASSLLLNLCAPVAPTGILCVCGGGQCMGHTASLKVKVREATPNVELRQGFRALQSTKGV